MLIPLPDRDFDPTETAVPWRVLSDAGHEVVFATEDGATPAGDPLLITGVVFGQLGAKPATLPIYEALTKSGAFEKPIRWKDIDVSKLDALVLPGGHAQGMKQYLGGALLHEKVAAFAQRRKPMAAICHGVLVLARAIDPETKKSVLFGRKTTCLPKYMERIAYLATAWKVGKYYRTYDDYVEDEVKAALEDASHFRRGPLTLFTHGTQEKDEGAFVCEDGSYVSARWPGDAWLFAKKIADRLS